MTRLTNLLSTLFPAARPGEEIYRALFEQASDAILICDSAGHILESNPAATDLLGYSDRELAMMNIADLYCRRDARQKSFAYDKLLAQTTTRKDTVFRRKSFLRIQVEVTEQMLPDGRIVANIRDIGERKRTEETLTAAIERYHILARAYGDTVWDWDLIANTRIYEPGLKTLTGYNLRHIDNATAWSNERLHPEDLQKTIAALQEALTYKLEHLKLEYRFRCADGSYKYILDRSFIVYNSNMNAVRIIGSMQDITQTRDEEKCVGQALLEDISQIPDGALLKDLFQKLLSSVEVRKKYNIDFQFDDKLNDIANETIMLNLYRILQEQLKNIISYSDAAHIAIIMRVCEKHISFTIGDDGRGFDTRNGKKGIGLNNIRRSVEALSGKLKIITEPGEGCVLISEIPF